MSTERIGLGEIVVDPAYQPREYALDEAHAADIAAWLAEDPDRDTPPVDLFRLPSGVLTLAHGNHRYAAYRRAGRADIPAVVHAGDEAAARLFAAGTNKENTTLRRTNADKRRAVRMALDAAPGWSNRRIAEHVGVTHTLVNEVRGRPGEAVAVSGGGPVEVSSTPPPAGRVGKDGRCYQPARRVRPPAVPPGGDGPAIGITDATGYPVPPHLCDSFAEPTLETHIARLEDLRARLGEVHTLIARELARAAHPFCRAGPACETLAGLVRPGSGVLARVIEALAAGVPYAVCRQCRGSVADCPDCRGSGHLPAWRFEELGQGEVIRDRSPAA